MRIIHFDLNSHLENEIMMSVSAIGFFDGLHNGHKQLISEAIKEAKSQGVKSSMITFSPSPASVLSSSDEVLLTSVSERVEIARELGIDQFIILKFSRNLSSLTPDEFYEKVIKKLKIIHLVCGEDFKYGYRGSGSVATLKLIEGLGLTVINDYNIESERVSSSRIKESVMAGDLELSEKLLGYPYFINGYVKHGRKKGRTIGFPTVNLSYSKSKVLPALGIYIGYVTLDNKNYIATINVGHNPTINTMKDVSIEAFLHDYDDNAYDKAVKFHFIKKIREELKFESVEELITQMHKDIEVSENFFTSDMRGRYNIEDIWNSRSNGYTF